MHQHKTAFENIVGKEEIARNEQFLLFPMFSNQSDNCTPFVHIFDIIIGIWGKGLKFSTIQILQDHNCKHTCNFKQINIPNLGFFNHSSQCYKKYCEKREEWWH